MNGGRDLPRTVREMVQRYLEFARDYYQIEDNNGRKVSTGQAINLRATLGYFCEVAGDKAPDAISADDLCAMQELLQSRTKRDGTPYAREYINRACRHVRQMARWAAKPPRRWLSVLVLEDLKLADGLKAGRCRAIEKDPIPPVAESDFLATQSRLATYSYNPDVARWAQILSSALDILWHSGMRPGELMNMRNEPEMFSVDQVRLGGQLMEVMVYRPRRHKTRHHGMDRNIFLSPTCRRQVERVLAVTPPGERVFLWKTGSLRNAVARVQQRGEYNEDGQMVAAPPLTPWFPSQIRHAFATRMRAVAGLDVVQILMGHRNRSTTEIYALPDATAAISAIYRYA